MACRDVVALLTKEGARGLQKFVVIGSMRMMAGHAIFPHRRVLPNKRPAFFGVALVTGVVDRIRFHQHFGRRAVRVVTIDAGNFSFRQRHVRALVEFGTLLTVAGLAGFVDAWFFQ